MSKTSLLYSFMLVTTGLVAACFNTKDIQSGGLKCAPSSDPNSAGECPDGFFCGEGHLCYRNGTENVALCQASEAQSPFGPFPPASCAPPNQSVSLCDPVCQNGCSCAHRCQLAGNFEVGYSFACAAPPADPQLKTFDICDPNNDLCMPGRVCLAPPSDSEGCVSRCYRHCRQDADCPVKSRCTIPIDVSDGTNHLMTCSPPAVVCNPIQNNAAAACSNSPTGSTCYVFSSSYADETMCDCTGTRKAGETCKGLHSCEPGYECVGETCRKLCLQVAGAAGCAAGQSCVPYSGSTKYGTCQ